MNRKRDILSGALMLLLAGFATQSCREEDFSIAADPGRDELISRGQYLTARQAGASTYASDTQEPFPFEVGTPYRLLAFVKEYDPAKWDDDETLATHPRFNLVACEGEVPGRDLRYISAKNPETLLGFSALPGEPGAVSDDNLVSLDFYGFSYGEIEDPVENYLQLDDNMPNVPSASEAAPSAANWPEGKTLDVLKKTESVPVVTDAAGHESYGELKDLMRGVLLNQNIKSAGKTEVSPGKWVENPRTQSIIQFGHCFSRLRFFVSQQGSETDGTPVFTDLHVEGIKVLNTYKEGAVYLQDGKIDLIGNKINRQLRFNKDFSEKSGKVNVQSSDAGQIIVFPSDGSALKNTGLAAGYDVGLEITVKSTVKADIENMLRNTGSVGSDGEPQISEDPDEDGVTWYKGAIIMRNIPDYYNYNDTGEPPSLKFKQNTSYILIIAFQKGAVRIITVIPQVEEWLEGEGTSDDPWDYQDMGQPQMFDNIVWSDRNLGADEYDPTREDNYEETIGYFYQAGRNIPYYPFKWGRGHETDPADTLEKYYYHPDVEKEMREQNLANGVTKWGESEYSFYPVVDPDILQMHVHTTNNTKVDDKGNPVEGYYLFKDGELKRLVEFQWLMWPAENGEPQMYIPDERQEGYVFNFMLATSGNFGFGLKESQDMHWELGPSNQPVSGSWEIPSSKDFLTIFPSTPHAGNITFRKGDSNRNPMQWGNGGNIDDNGYSDQESRMDMASSFETLRVTVPFFYKDMKEPAYHSKDLSVQALYNKAWQTLADHDTIGTTHISGTDEAYFYGPGEEGNPIYEPEGDPDDGFASVYVISRKAGDVTSPKTLPPGAVIRSWGTVYAIKRVYTPQAYRMRWRVLEATASGHATNPCYYVEICRYRAMADDDLTEKNVSDYDWAHPVAKLYFPICGLGDWNGAYINFGTECQYATCDKIEGGATSAVQIKITGHDTYNAYISVVRGVINRNFGMQIRPKVGGG